MIKCQILLSGSIFRLAIHSCSTIDRSRIVEDIYVSISKFLVIA